ncbi:MAG TPA: FHA domain-containing protein [Gemmataceae bacterium]|nr:FHA domain-containing protein [Gemmataceae bacterium]
MSFRLFIFYCALCGAWAAFFGWMPGQVFADSDHPLVSSALMGMSLGLLIALALGIVDALLNSSLRQVGQLLLRVIVAVVVGSFGGVVGGFFGQLFFGLWPLAGFRVAGWTVTGLLIGASVGMFDLLWSVLLGRDKRGALKKLRNGVLGGAVGGLLGGILAVLLKRFWSGLFTTKDPDWLWSPTVIGFVVLGACISLFIGLAQVILKEAWLSVEQGFRKGRQLILSKPEVTIGRAEGCDVGLFGDAAVEKLHARIVCENGGSLITDLGTAGGTYVNDRRVAGPTPLRAGDLIRLGNCVLRFDERRQH